MLGGMWGARFDLKRKANEDENEAESQKANGEEGENVASNKEERKNEACGEARSLLSGLISNMLHSPISWASVYLADQASMSQFFFFSKKPSFQEFYN